MSCNTSTCVPLSQSFPAPFTHLSSYHPFHLPSHTPPTHLQPISELPPTSHPHHLTTPPPNNPTSQPHRCRASLFSSPPNCGRETPTTEGRPARRPCRASGAPLWTCISNTGRGTLGGEVRVSIHVYEYEYESVFYHSHSHTLTLSCVCGVK